MLDSARRLFLDQGYAATTVATIAGQAGVSVETVYKAFGNKPGVLKALFDVSVAGDDEPVPIQQRETIRRIQAETDPRRKLALHGARVSETLARSAPIELLVRAAAASDPGAASLMEQMASERLTGMTYFAQNLQEQGHLREGVSVDDARDILWTYSAAELYELLVIRRGWSLDRYGRWVADALVAALLP